MTWKEGFVPGTHLTWKEFETAQGREIQFSEAKILPFEVVLEREERQKELDKWCKKVRLTGARRPVGG